LTSAVPQAGLLRLISREPGQSQQAVARRLGTPPSRLVALVDGLEQRGLIETAPQPGDRRNYALHLTAAGEQAMTDLSQVSLEHEQAIAAPLTPAERAQLSKLLGKLAAAHGLVPGVTRLPQPVGEGVPVNDPAAVSGRVTNGRRTSWPGQLARARRPGWPRGRL